MYTEACPIIITMQTANYLGFDFRIRLILSVDVVVLFSI